MTRFASLLVAAALLAPTAAQAYDPSAAEVCAYAAEVAEREDDQDGLVAKALHMCDQLGEIQRDIARMEDDVELAEREYELLADDDFALRVALAEAKAAHREDPTEGSFRNILGLQRKFNAVRGMLAKWEWHLGDLSEEIERAYDRMYALEDDLLSLARAAGEDREGEDREGEDRKDEDRKDEDREDDEADEADDAKKRTRDIRTRRR